MKNTLTLLRIYLSGLPGGLGDMKRLRAEGLAVNSASIGNLLRYLKPKAGDLNDPAFFEASTRIMFGMIARAIVQIANTDEIGRFSAGNIGDGVVVMSIAGGPAWTLNVRGHVFSLERGMAKSFNAIMEFKDSALARDLFDGKVSALACVGRGLISMRGNLGMLDNVNRLLDRVAVYLGE